MSKILVLSTCTTDAKAVSLWGLKEAGHKCIVLGHASKNQELQYSKLCTAFIPIPEELTFEDKSEEIITQISQAAKEHDVDVICPSGFESVKFVSFYQDQLNAIKPCVPTPSLEAIGKISDKHLFANFCKEQGIPHPNTYLLEDLKVVEEGRLPVTFPLLTKPLRMSASRGIFTFNNKEDLLTYLRDQKEDGSNALPLLLQESIPGYDIDFNGFSRDGHLCAWTIQRFIEIPRKGDKPLRWIQFLRNDDILEIGRKIIAATKYSGPIHVDLRVDERIGQVVSIEVNPRFWASTFASMCDGVNFADVAIQSALNPQYTKEPNYSNKIWGTPHRIPLLLLKERDMKFVKYGMQHSFIQIKHRLLNKIYTGMANRALHKHKNGKN